MINDRTSWQKTPYFECRNYTLPIGKKTYVMGILNVTPDSFSDGGSYASIEEAIKRAKEMVIQGADMIDVGGESTRPGHIFIDPNEEIKRVVPVIKELVKEISIPISVDTSKAEVAREALLAGAHIINDVWGLQADPQLAKVAYEFDAGVIMMHNQNDKVYTNVMGDIIRFLKRSIEIAENAGIPRERMMVDPGIGFGKTVDQNLFVMKNLGELRLLKLPVLLGTSRKSMIGAVLGLSVEQRVEGTAATVAFGICAGADVIRIHDVKEMSRVAKMTDAMVNGSL